MMTPDRLLELIGQGESNSLEFKEEQARPESLAREMVAFANTLGLVHFDLSLVEGTRADDLDPAKLHDYWQGYYQIPYGDLDRGEQLNILRNADILVPLEEEWAVSVGGLLLFGRQPQRRLPHSALSFAVFDGDEITSKLLDKKELTGVLPESIKPGR